MSWIRTVPDDQWEGELEPLHGRVVDRDLGRVDHIMVGEQTGADQERVDEALKRMELVHCEKEPGDAVFFHGNLLHRSDANLSPHPRWTLICCYNAARNDPYKKHHHPNYTPLEKFDDEKILEIARRDWSALEARTSGAS